MNKNSLLCRYISEHPDWETSLHENYGIKIKRNGPYAIFNYNYDSDFSEPIVQESRGIILDVDEKEVVCWPFRKFGNFHESYADEIDWETACVQEKVDGSIVKLWFSEREDRWVFATNSIIDSAGASIESAGDGRTFADAIRSADNFADIHTEKLDRGKTYIFELVGPDTQIVVRYDRPMLYHTGTRNNVTGRETDEDIGIIRPERYPLRSFEDCIDAARKLNSGSESVEYEGFVVVDAAWNRVKIKSPDYIVKHRIAATYLSAENCFDLILNSGYSVPELCDIRPNDAAILKYYDWQIEEVLCLADRVAEMARALYEEYSHDRKAVAMDIKGHPLAFAGFRALGNHERGRDLISENLINILKKNVKPYPADRDRIFEK